MHPTPVRLPDQPPLGIRLPLDFAAFRQMRHTLYRRHALLRLGECPAADHAVEHALDALATDWCRILSSRRPARHAWQILTASIEDQDPSQTSAPPTAARTLYTLLPTRQADAMLLHLQHVPPHQAADLTGLDAAMHAYYLRTAQHTLDARLAPSP
ncbi:hypothetical protein [Streptomyces sp. NPDC018045]|uniref:hypothetical protein n=1 Tax=Streptomyces sp. NPDC018045 TaxID=3365037 RepID=UPI0037B10BE3